MDIVFDFGAVLISWQPALVVRRYFPDHTQDQVSAQALGHAMFTHPHWHAFDQGLLSADDVARRMAAQLDLPLAAMHGMVHSIGDHLEPIASSVAVLDALRQRRDAGEDLRLFYLSNMPVAYARTLQAKYTFISWFDDGIFSGDIQLVKPDPAIFTAATQRFGLRGDTTLFIDDLLHNIHAAQAHGWHTLHLPQPERLQSHLNEKIGLKPL